MPACCSVMGGDRAGRTRARAGRSGAACVPADRGIHGGSCLRAVPPPCIGPELTPGSTYESHARFVFTGCGFPISFPVCPSMSPSLNWRYLAARRETSPSWTPITKSKSSLPRSPNSRLIAAPKTSWSPPKLAFLQDAGPIDLLKLFMLKCLIDWFATSIFWLLLVLFLVLDGKRKRLKGSRFWSE